MHIFLCIHAQFSVHARAGFGGMLKKLGVRGGCGKPK